MPTYEYACKSCGEHLEVVQSFTDDSLTTCLACGGPLRKVFGNIGISFKGSGFYKNDSRSTTSSTSPASAENGSGPKDGADAKNGSGAKEGSDAKNGSGPKESTGAKDGSGSDRSSTKESPSSPKDSKPAPSTPAKAAAS